MIVGATSMTWWNWVRSSPLPWTPFGQCTWRAIDLFEGDKINAVALKKLVRAAIDYNQTSKDKKKKKAGTAAKARKNKKA